ncbi:hypothetical protein GJ496_001943 [Pomphorhynchus laevis]|nr:hypothetical protein GJ496_001943 [Pomphorhynchus laevis]
MKADGNFNELNITCATGKQIKDQRQFMNKICKSLDLVYRADIEFCSLLKLQYESLTPFAPIIKDDQDIDSRHKTCFLAGMMYNSQGQQCVHYPVEIDLQQAQYYKRYLVKHIKEYFSIFCEISGLQYNPTYGFCLRRESHTISEPKFLEHLTHDNEIKNRHLCFIEGMRLLEFQKKPACSPFPRRGPEIKTLRPLYEPNKAHFISRRCPSYMEYHSQVGFCVRKPPLEANLYDFKRIFRLFGIRFYKGKDKHQRGVNLDFAKCCIENGMDYRKSTHVCVRYLSRPTAYEAGVYRAKYKEKKQSIIREQNKTLQ